MLPGMFRDFPDVIGLSMWLKTQPDITYRTPQCHQADAFVTHTLVHYAPSLLGFDSSHTQSGTPLIVVLNQLYCYVVFNTGPSKILMKPYIKVVSMPARWRAISHRGQRVITPSLVQKVRSDYV